MMDNPKNRARPIHFAVVNKALECANYLASKRANLNEKDINGNTPFHLAVLNKDLDMLQLLDEKGADALIKNNDQLSAIDLCYSDLNKSVIGFFRSRPRYSKLVKPNFV